MQENCSKVINALLEVQEQIKSSAPPPTRRSPSPSLDWVSVDVGCGQCDHLQASLEEHIRKLTDLAGQIQFATGILLQMHEELQPPSALAVKPESVVAESRPAVASTSSPSAGSTQSLSRLPANLVATVMELAAEQDPLAVLKLSGVSRSFRRIALSNRSLWTRIDVTALPPAAVDLHLQRSGTRGLCISATYTGCLDVAVQAETERWTMLLGIHGQRITSLLICGPGRLALDLATSLTKAVTLPSLRRVELLNALDIDNSRAPLPLLRWDAFNSAVNVTHLSGDAVDQLPVASSLLHALENAGLPVPIAPEPSQLRTGDTSVETVTSSMLNLEMVSPAPCSDVKMDLEVTPRPGGKPSKTNSKPRHSTTPSTIVASESTPFPGVTTFDPSPVPDGPGKMPEAADQAMDVEPGVSVTRKLDLPVDGDPEDADDPLMVSEYAREIYDHLLKLEVTLLPDPKKIERQEELDWRHRGILAEWLYSVVLRFKLLPETFWMTMNLIDRFLCKRTVSMAKFQLVGMACLHIASKFHEVVTPTVKSWIGVMENAFTVTELVTGERYIMKLLEYRISCPNPLDFLRLINKVDDYDIQIRTLAKYLALIQCFTGDLVGIPPSRLAAAAYWLARVSLDKIDWTENHVKRSCYEESDLIPHANAMVRFLLKPVSHESLQNEWSTKKNLKAAVFARDWAAKHWKPPSQSDSEVPTPDAEADNVPVDVGSYILKLREAN